MRLLHTSDWHLGRSLHGQPLIDAQAAFLDFLVDVARDEGIDALLVAGDVYDRAVPPVEAVELFDHALARLAALRVPVVAVSGNHDSSTRLGFGAGLLSGAGVHLRTDPRDAGCPVMLGDDDGPVAVYALPYLEPELTWTHLEAAAPRHEAVLAAAVRAARADLATRDPRTRCVVVAHAFVGNVGEARVCDSERDITVGGTAIVPAALFSGAHYVALGHLHGFQEPIASRVTYSGSPLAYSFSEAEATKSVSVVELGPTGAVTLERVPCPVIRPLARVRASLRSLLTDAVWTDHEDHFLAVTLTDPQVPTEPMGRLRERFPGVLQLTITARQAAVEGGYRERLEGVDDLGIATRFVRDMRHREADPDERALLRGAFEAGRVAAAVR